MVSVNLTGVLLICSSFLKPQHRSTHR